MKSCHAQDYYFPACLVYSQQMLYSHLICQNVSQHGSHFRPELAQLGAFWAEYSRCIIVTKPKVITFQFFALCQNVLHRNGSEAKEGMRGRIWLSTRRSPS